LFHFKENVQPQESAASAEPIESTREDDPTPLESHPIPTTTSSTGPHQHNNRKYEPLHLHHHLIIVHAFRRYSNRAHPYASSSHKQPNSKRRHRSYSQSSGSSSPSSSPPKNGNYPYRKETSPHHGNEAMPSNDGSYERTNYYPIETTSSDPSQQYNPEAPDLDYDRHVNTSMYHRQPFNNNHQRTLVTVVTHNESDLPSSSAHPCP
jgi:hypothetical protein